MKVISFFLLTVYLHLSCTPTRKHYYQYSINIQEIDGKAKKIISTIKNLYISSPEGLFEYDYKLKTLVTIGSNDQITQKESDDSSSISFIPQNKVIYYQFDLKGNFIFSDSIKKKATDFIKINPENKEHDPVYNSLIKIREADLLDTSFNGINYKIYTVPNGKDSLVEEPAVQLFFIKNNNLKTPFNIAGRYPTLLGNYCFAGVLYHILSADRKLISIISDIKPVTNEQLELCKLIQKKMK